MARASHTSSIEPGRVLAGRYELTRLIGEGGMGMVFEARHLRLDTRVAIKVLRPDAAENPEIVRRFDREARAAAQLASAHVARVIDVDSHDDGMPFMVMEYLEGRDLDAVLRQRGALPYATAVDYVLQVCDAMGEAHALGIVHRDLKPENLFLDESGPAPTIKVLDFGISKVPLGDDAKRTETAAAFGTPTYMSPDQIQSAKNVDARADIWSLGVILYELICGKPPFHGENATATIWSICMDEPEQLERLTPGIPAALGRAVMKCLAKDRTQRYRSVAELSAALRPHRSDAAAAVKGDEAPAEPPHARADTPTVEMASPESGHSDAAVVQAVTSSLDDTTLPHVAAKPEPEQTGGMVTPLPVRRAARAGMLVIAAALGIVVLISLTRMFPERDAASGIRDATDTAAHTAPRPAASIDPAPEDAAVRAAPPPSASAIAATTAAPSASSSARPARRRPPTPSREEVCRRDPARCR